MTDTYILGLTRGHNGSVTLLKNGEVIYYIEEERLSRFKYDGTPFLSMELAKKYTNKIDAIAIAHTDNNVPRSDWCRENIYFELLRKHKLVDYETPVYNLGQVHHQLHAACAFYNSGFDDAAAVIVDGAGSIMEMQTFTGPTLFWEAESIFECSYPTEFVPVYKNFQTNSAVNRMQIPSEMWPNCEAWLSDNPGIVKCYEGVTGYCGFEYIEAGKTMGLAPYGEEDPKIADFFLPSGVSNRNLITPRIPNGSEVNTFNFPFLADVTLQNQKNLAYKLQKDTQEAVLKLILTAIEKTGKKNIVVAGGYGLNCVANYYYLDKLPEGTNLYVEPISHDGGTSMGAAKLVHFTMFQNDTKKTQKNIYYGPTYELDKTFLQNLDDFNAKNVVAEDVAKLIHDKNIVCIFQGGCEGGPRALGNRSILFDPTVPNGKDIVNEVKRREWFRPFAGSILKEHVHEWFDMKTLDESPFMMYAVDVKEDKLGVVPSITHVDNTCRVQTVTKEQNLHYYNLIEEFYKLSEVPILFNTSFNLAGDPLVETIDDALDTLRKSDLRYLYLPEISLLLEKK